MNNNAHILKKLSNMFKNLKNVNLNQFSIYSKPKKLFWVKTFAKSCIEKSLQFL